MTATRIPIDGLWRALCPSFEALLLSRLNTSLLQRAGTHLCSWNATPTLPHPQRSRTARQLHSGRVPQVRLETQVQNWSFSENRSRTPQAVQGNDDVYNDLEDVPTAKLHDILRQVRKSGDIYGKTVKIVEYLVGVRGEKPSLIHYEALIFANADPQRGSAEVVAQLWLEMEQEGIVPDSGLYHSALHALAVHPDYIFRSKILREMKERWLEPTRDGWHHIIVGLLRDRQYEIALDKLDEMQGMGIKAHSWLYDIFIYLFCEAKELDEALWILKHRVENRDPDISANIWYYMLDICSRDSHYEGTSYIWRRRVPLDYLNPSDGMCVNILNTAARFGDAQLATEVVRVLTKRKSKVDVHHYEALLEAYIGSGDLKNGLRILTIMKRARLEPYGGTTRPIYSYLCRDQHLPSEALNILKELSKGGNVLPVAAVNCVLEAFIFHDNLDEAIERYKSFHDLCPSGPNKETFNTLLQGCSRAKRKDLAMFLAAEMVATGVRPDALTYDRLILVCMTQDDYEDAFRYLEEMGEMVKNLRLGTWNAVVRRCVANKDPRAWRILGSMKARGLPTEKMQKWVYKEWFDDGSGPSLEELEALQDVSGPNAAHGEHSEGEQIKANSTS